MKAISPIVAAVLLIAITMTIAGGLAYWSSTFISARLPGVNATEARCDFAQFEFLSCSFDASAQQLKFALNNIGSIPLTNLTAFVHYGNGSISANTLTGDLGLGTESVKSYSVSASSDFSELRIKTNCPQVERLNSCR